jgi:hypothetical protein
MTDCPQALEPTTKFNTNTRTKYLSSNSPVNIRLIIINATKQEDLDFHTNMSLANLAYRDTLASWSKLDKIMLIWEIRRQDLEVMGQRSSHVKRQRGHAGPKCVHEYFKGHSGCLNS